MAGDTKKGAKKGAEFVKDAAVQAGETVINKAKEKVDEVFGKTKLPVQRDQDDSYKFGK